MPLSSLSVGRDTTLQIYDPNAGGIVTLTKITEFESKPDTVKLKSKGLDGIVIHAVEPDGWSGTITVDRMDPNVDRLFGLLESNYYAGINIQNQTITQTVKEADGTYTQYIYAGVALNLDDAGMWSNGKQVTQKLSWCSSKRNVVK